MRERGEKRNDKRAHSHTTPFKNKKTQNKTRKTFPAVCLKSEKEFEDTKGLVVKEFNHDKPSGKVSWKAEKVGEYFFVDPEKCGRGVELTVEVAEYKGRK